ncbi:rhamnogalacturonan lyase [Sphingomonas montana]|uniref:rhamnogalacturonan lyase n=1 Tax=Sphingomonas montana TaxID=1843236 RepID=UPI00096DC6E1|nr:rhamnogalacturonan lyase [Sphingomonas montana]
MPRTAVIARILAGLSLATLAVAACAAPPAGRLEMLDRGMVAVPAAGGNHVSWRLLATDPTDAAFVVLRDGRRIAPGGTTGQAGATSLIDRQGTPASIYTVARADGVGRAGRAGVWRDGYLTIPIDKPADRTTPAGETYSYRANDASVGDLDGDGRYEIVLKWDPSISKDNAFGGYSGETLVDAYTLDGKRLWRIDLGHNIRSGAHYSPIMVADLDGDGRAEIAMKTADGTVDGAGKPIGDAKADWRGRDGQVPQADRTGAITLPDGRKVASMVGRIVRGPEYLTVFDGRSGRALATAPYAVPRDDRTDSPDVARMTEIWGDGYANRSDRHLAGVAWLDGRLPSLVFGRGYYARTTVAAWDYRGGRLTRRWLFDSGAPGNADYGGRGNHQLSVADVDGDGRDEVIYGSMAIDDNGRGLWTVPLFHGDAMHVSDLDPARPGLEKFGVQEDVRRNGGIGSAMLDARTGAILWTKPADKDTGRGLAIDIDPRHWGAEAWGSNSAELYDAKGTVIPGGHPRSANFGLWWDGDRLRELLDGNRISKWDWTTGTETRLLTADGTASNNGTKSNPALSADLIGDWREEVLLRTADDRALRLYTTPIPTTERIVTLMQDPVYRAGVAWQNGGYNQPPHVSYYLGAPAPR